MKTAKQIKDKVKATGLKRLDKQKCHECHEPYGYVFEGDKVYFESCGCMEPKVRTEKTYDDVAHFYNDQHTVNFTGEDRIKELKSNTKTKELDKVIGFK